MAAACRGSAACCASSRPAWLCLHTSVAGRRRFKLLRRAPLQGQAFVHQPAASGGHQGLPCHPRHADQLAKNTSSSCGTLCAFHLAWYAGSALLTAGAGRGHCRAALTPMPPMQAASADGLHSRQPAGSARPTRLPQPLVAQAAVGVQQCKRGLAAIQAPACVWKPRWGEVDLAGEGAARPVRPSRESKVKASSAVTLTTPQPKTSSHTRYVPSACCCSTMPRASSASSRSCSRRARQGSPLEHKRQQSRCARVPAGSSSCNAWLLPCATRWGRPPTARCLAAGRRCVRWTTARPSPPGRGKTWQHQRTAQRAG